MIVNKIKKIISVLKDGYVLFILLFKKPDNFDFVILTMPRSGSTLLSDFLNNHKEITCYDEIFHYSGFFNNFSNRRERIKIYKSIRVFFFKKMASYLKQDNKKLLGCKIIINNYFTKKNTQLEGRLKKYVLEDNNLKIILLKRRNLVRRYISNKIARKTNIWHIKDNKKQLNKIYFDFNEFIDYANNEKETMKNFYNNLKNKKRVLEVFYEDLSGENRDNILKKIQSFLNVEYHELYSDFKKINDYEISDMISNYGEIKNSIKEWEKTIT